MGCIPQAFRLPHEGIAIYIFAVATTALLLFSIGSERPYWGLVLFAFLPIGLLKPIFLIPVFFISSLSSDFFEASQGVGFTRVFAFVIIASVLLGILRNTKKVINKKWISNCIFIIVATLLSFLLAYDDDIEVLYSIVFNILVFIAIVNLAFNKTQLEQVVRAIFFAVLITTAYFAITVAINPQFFLDTRLTIAQGVNENRFGMMLAQLAAYSLGYMYFSKITYVKIVCFVAFLINIILVFLTGSRSALAGVLLGFSVSMLITLYHKKGIRSSLIPFVLVFAAAAAIFSILVGSSPWLAQRMDIHEMILTQKTEGNRGQRIAAEIENLIPDHPIFGVGPGAGNEKIGLDRYNTPDPGSSHNIIFSLLSQLGLVGFVAYTALFAGIIKNLVFKLQSQRILIIPLILILTAVFNGVGEMIYSERFFWIALALAALCLSTFANIGGLRPSKTSPSTAIL